MSDNDDGDVAYVTDEVNEVDEVDEENNVVEGHGRRSVASSSSPDAQDQKVEEYAAKVHIE